MAQQRELRREPGAPFDVEQFSAAGRERGEGPVHCGEHLGDARQDGGADGRVADVQVGDHLGKGLKPEAPLFQTFPERGGLGDGGDHLGVGGELFGLVHMRVEDVLTREEGHGALPGSGDVRCHVTAQGFDGAGVGVAHLAEREQVSMGPAQFGDALDPLLGSGRGLATDAAHQPGDAPGGLREGVGRLPGEGGDGLELVEDLLGGGPHRLQRATQLMRPPRRPARGSGRRP